MPSIGDVRLIYSRKSTPCYSAWAAWSMSTTGWIWYSVMAPNLLVENNFAGRSPTRDQVAGRIRINPASWSRSSIPSLVKMR